MRKMIRMGSVLIAGMVLLTGAYQYRTHRLQENLAEKILRFHVIANSDSKLDQNLKLKVRDEIGGYLQKELKEVSDLTECEAVVNDHLAEIENCAREVIAKEGYQYCVNASVTNAKFPIKTYGDYTFPKGEYKALKVVIGAGQGKNWWCVMYPNLCFSDAVYEVVDEKAKRALEEVLTKEDYSEIMAEGKIKIKFKYFEKLLDEILLEKL